MSMRYFVSATLLCGGLVTGAAATEERPPQTTALAPETIAPVEVAPARPTEPIVAEMQALERHVRVDMICFMPVRMTPPVLAVAGLPK
jgi:hypothetical protein